MRPDHGFIGCEPFLNGVVGALGHIRDGDSTNVRLHMGDALEVVERLPDASLDRVYLLHPDPWPKARHAKRRMINHGPLDLIAAKLKPGAEFRLGTDDPTYCRWAMMMMNQRRDFDWLAQTPRDFLTRPDDWPETRYERKARRQGHEVWYFRYRRALIASYHCAMTARRSKPSFASLLRHASRRERADTAPPARRAFRVDPARVRLWSGLAGRRRRNAATASQRSSARARPSQ